MSSLGSRLSSLKFKSGFHYLLLCHPEEVINVSVSFPVCKICVMVVLAFLDCGVVV